MTDPPPHTPTQHRGGPAVPPQRITPCHGGRPGSWRLLRHRSSTVTPVSSRCQHNQGTNLLNLLKSFSSAVPLEREKNIYIQEKQKKSL